MRKVDHILMIGLHTLLTIIIFAAIELETQDGLSTVYLQQN